MKIEKYSPNTSEELMFCKSTNETIPFPLYHELIESSDAIIAFWSEGHIDMPFIKNKALQNSWNDIYSQWDAAEKSISGIKVLEKFLADYENAQWKVMQCAFTFMTCTRSIIENMFIVVKADTVLKVDPDYFKEARNDKDKDEEKPENQIVVIETGYPINCPFCGELIRDDDEDSPCFYEGGRCEHLLFEATDYGFEYRSEIFNLHMGIEAKGESHTDEFYPEDEDYAFDGFTSKVTIPGSIKYAVYEGLGGSLGAYFGFVPKSID